MRDRHNHKVNDSGHYKTNNILTSLTIIYKSKHHLEKLQHGIPRALQEKSEQLSDHIRPFHVTTETRQLIEITSNQWANNVVNILRRHYEALINEHTRILSALWTHTDDEQMTSMIEQVKYKCRRDLGKRFTNRCSTDTTNHILEMRATTTVNRSSKSLSNTYFTRERTATDRYQHIWNRNQT